MLHKCVVNPINGCKQNAYADCENRYDKNKVSEATVFGELGYPVYKRCSDKDLKVALHNRSILIVNMQHPLNHVYIYIVICLKVLKEIYCC